MYFPYLRGKQFELLAIRDFADDNQSNENIVPIIEPVKKQFNGLNTAFDVLLSKHMRFAVVLNPKDGDFKHSTVRNDIISNLTPLMNNIGSWIPAYIYKNNPETLLSHATTHGFTNLMIVFPNGVDFTNAETISFLKNEIVSYIVDGNSKSRSSRSQLLRLGKNIISLEDSFKTKIKNADYAENVDEFFSEDFAFYRDDGLYGFADYTTIGKDFIDGGMLPYAIAIHLTYLKSEQQLYVHHFVSDSNFDQSNIKGKYYEASQKIESFYDEYSIIRTPSVDELIEKASADGYPGLGYIKKLSIKNHLELINCILSA